MSKVEEQSEQTEGEEITQDEMLETLNEMKVFMARRFDEVSMEINATSQQIDMNEEDLQKRFGEILQTLGTITYHSESLTAANTGSDLESVIEETEDAANKILDAADRIAERIEKDQNLDNPEKRKDAIADIRKDIEVILMACSFQDLTGQRIRKALETITDINTNLNSTLGKIGINVEVKEEDLDNINNENRASSQEDIDDMFD